MRTHTSVHFAVLVTGLLLVPALQANIQDVFNENGVRIMSPRYETDTDQPKLLPPDRCDEAPARKSA